LPDGKFGVVCYSRDISEQIRARERLKLLLEELNHRVKNTLAIVQSIATRTLRSATGTEEARIALEARLMALSRAHDLLTQERWEGVALRELITRSLRPFSGENESSRLVMDGPDLRLRPKAAVAISMALNELGTNAIKYGALSKEAGQVTIVWNFNMEEPARFHLKWQESGGPLVSLPQLRGFGSRMIEQGLAYDLAGKVVLDFEKSGLACSIDAPLHEISGGSDGFLSEQDSM